MRGFMLCGHRDWNGGAIPNIVLGGQIFLNRFVAAGFSARSKIRRIVRLSAFADGLIETLDVVDGRLPAVQQLIKPLEAQPLIAAVAKKQLKHLHVRVKLTQ
jgi:hypothetical protein